MAGKAELCGMDPCQLSAQMQLWAEGDDTVRFVSQAQRISIEAPSHFPLKFIGGFADMKALFYHIAKSRAYPPSYASRIWAMLPTEIGTLPCFLDRLTGIWRYEWGEPLNLETGPVIGTTMFPEVEKLFDVLGCAEWRLGKDQLSGYLRRLTNKAKHYDALIEFAPILRLSDAVNVRSEVSSAAAGSSTVDWRIEAPGYPPLLLEVKNRVYDLIESLEAISRSRLGNFILEPSHDPKLLFRSVEKKFGARRPTEAIQCVWIKTGLKQEKDGLHAAFEALKPGRLHAVVLGTWDEEAYVLAVDSLTKQLLKRILRLRQSGRLVFKRRPSGEPT